MSLPADFSTLLERFFTKRLMSQRQVSPNTIASYRDTFRLFVQFVYRRLKKRPCDLAFSDIDVTLVEAFLDGLESSRSISARSRNLRLSAIRSFFRYAAYSSQHTPRAFSKSWRSLPSDTTVGWSAFSPERKSMNCLPPQTRKHGSDGVITHGCWWRFRPDCACPR